MKAARIALVIMSVFLLSCGKKSDKDTVVSQRFVHKYGFDLSEQEWFERSQEGKIVTTTKDGVVLTQNFVEGVLHGETTYTFPNSSTIQEKDIYNEGFLAKKIIMNEKGLPVCEEEYKLDGRRITTFWNEAGAPLFQEEYEKDFLISGSYYNSENEIEARVISGEGYRTKRDLNGTLLSKDKIENGQLIARTTFYPGGEMQSHATYLDYKLHGEQVKYAPSGQPLIKMQWENGELNGLKVIYKSGFKYQEIPFVKGKKEGIEKRFDKEGMVIAEINWKSDSKHGSSRFFSPKVKIEWYYNGTLVTAERFRDLQYQEKFLNDIKEANNFIR